MQHCVEGRLIKRLEVELLAQREFYILSISIYKVLQLDDENRNVDMKLFLEETFSQYQKLIENSNVVAKKVKDKLTLLESANDAGTLGSVSSSSTPLIMDPILNENSENEQITI